MRLTNSDGNAQNSSHIDRDLGYAATTALDGSTAGIDITTTGGQLQNLRLTHPVSQRAGTAYTLMRAMRAERHLVGLLAAYRVAGATQ